MLGADFGLVPAEAGLPPKLRVLCLVPGVFVPLASCAFDLLDANARVACFFIVVVLELFVYLAICSLSL